MPYHGLRVLASCVLYVPEGSLPRGATHCTHGVRVPALGVPYVPRTFLNRGTTGPDTILSRVSSESEDNAATTPSPRRAGISLAVWRRWRRPSMILFHGLEAAVTELRRGVDELEDGQSSVEQELSDRVDTDEQADLTSTCLVYSSMHTSDSHRRTL